MRKALLFAALLLAAAAAPVLAGSSYAPLISGTDIDGNNYTTEIEVSNPAPAGRRFGTFFIPAGVDGSTPDRPIPEIGVPGGRALTLPTGQLNEIGLYEIYGAPQLNVSAILRVFDQQDFLVGAIELPVLTSDNMLQPGETVHLLDLAGGVPGVDSNLSLINLAQESTECAVALYRADASQIGATALISVNPLTHVQFDAIFALLGEEAVADVRVDVSCDQPFYTFATVVSISPQSVRLSQPSASLNNDLEAPGRTPPIPPGTVTVTREGDFFEVAPGNSEFDLQFDLVEGRTYKRVTLDFDLFIDRFTTPLFHVVARLSRTDFTLYYGMYIRGSNRRTIFDMDRGRELNDSGPWDERSSYHINIVYDTDDGRLTALISQNGQVVSSVTGPIENFDISNNGNKMRIRFGLIRPADDAFFPPNGWRFSNLELVAEPFD